MSHVIYEITCSGNSQYTVALGEATILARQMRTKHKQNALVYRLTSDATAVECEYVRTVLYNR